MEGLPVKRIVFYKHGIGCVERRGRVEGDGISLQFKRSDMNDILKSLLVFDSGGKVSAVNYQSHEDVEKRRKSALEIPQRSAVTGLLEELKGCRISVMAEKELKGKVIGIEYPQGPEAEESQLILVNNNSEEGKEAVLSLLDDEGSVHFVGVKTIRSVSIDDGHALEDLRYSLDLAAGERQNDMKSVTICLEGGKAHELSATYIMGMPVWRASYRLYISEDGPILQGWGMVDNPLEEDLEDVEISLVAGHPVSFVYDFYAPPSSKRPVISEYAAAVSSPIELERSIKMRRAEFRTADEEPVRFDIKRAEAKMKGPAFTPMRYEDSIEVEAEGAQVGALFRYDIMNPVDIKRGQSAMLPIIQQKVEGSKAIIYNGERNPVRAFRLRNRSGLTLERGPLTVFEEGTYAGEAMMPFTPESAEQSIAYAIELGLEVDKDESYTEEFSESGISGRFLVKSVYCKSRTDYLIMNKTDKPMTLLLEHGKRDGYELIEPKKPDEETENRYRWSVEVPAGKSVEFGCTLGRQRHYQQKVADLSMESLDRYVEKGELTGKLRDALSAIAKRSDDIRRLEEELEAADGKREALYEEQDRLRKNVKSISKEAGGSHLMERYLSKLEEQEKEIEGINDRKAKIGEEIESTKAEMDDLIAGLGD